MITVKGIDISNNNGNVNLYSVSKQNIKYVYLKATEGSTFKDSYMNKFYNSCKTNNLKVGAYHYLVSTSSPQSQAHNFFAKISSYSWDLIPMLDIEVNFSNLTSYILRFIAEFKKLCPLELGIYTYTSFIPYLQSIQTSIKNMKLWEANYNNTPWKLNNNFFLQRIGHQYSEKGIVGNFKGDVNEFTEGALISKNTTLSGIWILQNNKWWYRHSDGTYTKNNWEFINNEWYLFDDEGWMLYGWNKQGGNWYYLGQNDDGSMKTEWVFDNGKWYYLNDNGVMQVGWIKYKKEWYYLDKDGSMKTGWIKYDNKDYLLYSNGIMAHDTILYGYRFASDGSASKI